jgi:hypothetical protein
VTVWVRIPPAILVIIQDCRKADKSSSRPAPANGKSLKNPPLMTFNNPFS